MKSIYTLLFVIAWATAAPKADQEGFAPKRQTFHPSKNQGQYGLAIGDDTTIDRYPYNVALVTPDNKLLGGGMIYKDQWIITGGHVGTRPVSNITVRVGSTYALVGGELFNVTKVFNPPLYEKCATLVKLDRKIKFCKRAKSIRIAKYISHLGGSGDVTGYSETVLPDHDIKLQSRNTKFYDRNTCRNNWQIYLGPSMEPTEICANSDSCKENKGDPLVKNGKAIGLFSHSVDCSNTSIPVIFCNLTRLRKWIENTVWNDKASHER